MHHPSSALPVEWIDPIRKQAAGAEASGQLTPVQLDIIYRERWFKLFVPGEWGGKDTPLPDAVRLEEGIAWADGSMGWVVTLCAGAGLFSGYMDKTLAAAIFSNPLVCLAGSGQTNGLAQAIPGGFSITGSWDYSSGAPHATHFTANCRVTHDGAPYTSAFVFDTTEVRLSPNWNYLGLNATAGHSFSINRLTVPDNRSFQIGPQAARWPQAIYRYPFLQLAESTIAANLSGMCIHFLELAGIIIDRKENKGRQTRDEAVKQIDGLRESFYTVLDASWNTHVAGHEIPLQQWHTVSRASLELAQGCRYWVDLVYPHCGLEAARTGSAINRAWRDIHTASQHALLSNG